MPFFKNRAILLQALFQASFETPHCTSAAIWFGAQESAAIKRSAPATGVLWSQCLSITVQQVDTTTRRRGGRDKQSYKAPAFQLTGKTANISAPVHLSP